MAQDLDAVDIAALCRAAGVPADDPGVLRLVQIVARHCADLCDGFEPIGDAEHVPRRQARATGAELGVQIRALFGLD